VQHPGRARRWSKHGHARRRQTGGRKCRAHRFLAGKTKVESSRKNSATNPPSPHREDGAGVRVPPGRRRGGAGPRPTRKARAPQHRRGAGQSDLSVQENAGPRSRVVGHTGFPSDRGGDRSAYVGDWSLPVRPGEPPPGRRTFHPVWEADALCLDPHDLRHPGRQDQDLSLTNLKREEEDEKGEEPQAYPDSIADEDVSVTLAPPSMIASTSGKAFASRGPRFLRNYRGTRRTVGAGHSGRVRARQRHR